MKKIQMTVSTTHVDRHRDKVTREALEDMAKQIKERYLPMQVEHDIRYPPVGRVISAEVVELPDGEYALQGAAEIFEEDDSLESLRGDGRTISVDSRDITTIAVEYDRTFRSREGQELIHELSGIAGEDDQPKQVVKKALDPLSTLVILAGVFIVGQISKGFFSKLGADLYDKLKSTLIKYFRKEVSSEQVLDLCFLVKKLDRNLEVHVLVSNPTEKKLSEVFASKFGSIDELIASIPISELDIVKIVLEYANQEFSLRYLVRRDAVPVMFSRSEGKGRNS